MRIRLRARKSFLLDTPADGVRPLLRVGAWGWELTQTSLTNGDRSTFEEAVNFCAERNRAWGLGLEEQVNSFLGRIGGVPTCELLPRLLRGELIKPGNALAREVRVVDSYLALVEAEAMVLRTNERVIAFWDGSTPRDLVQSGGACLSWAWDGLHYVGPTGEFSVSGWRRFPTTVVTTEGVTLPGLHRMTAILAPMDYEVSIHRVPLREIWAGWLADICSAMTFAGQVGVVGVEPYSLSADLPTN